MTALAGIWDYGGRIDRRAAVSSMLSAQARYGPGAAAVAELGAAAMGRCLFELLPEDRFDAQPLFAPSGARMLVADVRIDNREELLGLLGRPLGAEISDSGLLALAHERWGEDLLDRIVGDFAFALWDERRELLTLVRDPIGQRPLFYHIGDGFAAFASMPQGLRALPQVPDRLDRRQLAEFVADMPKAGSRSFFEGLQRVEPGQILTISRGGATGRGYWEMPRREIRYAREEDYAEALREQLDRATRPRLRSTRPLLGAHLSAGLDSSAVAATAACLLAATGGRLAAFTSAPRAGFDGPVPPGRIADESAIAAATAAFYPNIEHVVIRPDGESPLQLIARDSEMFQEPIGHPCNYVWWAATNEQARARGISVMLTGESGNLTISAGGLAMLSQLVRQGRLLRWLREARAVSGTGPSWRGVLLTSFAPWIPRLVWNALLKAGSAYQGSSEGAFLLSAELRDAVAPAALARSRGSRPGSDEKAVRWKLLASADAGVFRKGVLARWGIDERDPTGDRRLAEFCFALPPEQFFGGGVTRRLVRHALADRLPPAVLNGVRGYQYADWYEALDAGALARELGRLRASPEAAPQLDVDRLDSLIERWPAQDWGSPAAIGAYRIELLRALSAGRFAAAIRQ